MRASRAPTSSPPASISPAHRDQLASTIALIESGTAAGHGRIVEQNEQLKLNLINIVEGLEALPGHEAGPDG
jgi:hypothetical protein